MPVESPSGMNTTVEGNGQRVGDWDVRRAGRSTVPDELRRRGHLAIDADYGGWKLPDGTWEPRMKLLLGDTADVVVSGTVEN